MYVCFTAHITPGTFADEQRRRARLEATRAAAAQRGYRGRVSFARVPGHGGNPIIAVRVWAEGW